MFTLYAVRYNYARINFKPPLCQYFTNAHSRVFTCINSNAYIILKHTQMGGAKFTEGGGGGGGR